jgi:Mrp family chromosome partitioning ATPase
MISTTEASASAKRGGGGAVARQYHALVQWICSTANASAVEATTIGVTSCGQGAGVSSVAANLAIAAAESCGGRVLLLDLSGSQRVLARRLGLPGDLKLSDALASDSDPSTCARETPIENLWLLSASESAAGDDLESESTRVYDLLRELERDFRIIVIDLPPTDSGLCFATAGTLNGVILVMESERTRCEAAMRAKQRLIHANAALLGVILNKHARNLPNWLDARL